MSARLPLYIARHSLRGFAVAALVVFTLIALVDFVEANRDLDANSALTPIDLFRLTLLETPSLFGQTLPFVVLFGTIAALTALNRRSELIAARAAGVSAWRTLRPVFGCAAALGVVWIVAGNPLAGKALARYEAIRAADANAHSRERASAVWLRETVEAHRALLRADRFDPGTRTLHGVTYWTFARRPSGDRLTSRVDARAAQWLPTGYLRFSDAREWTSGSYGPSLESLALPTRITERELLDAGERGGERAQPVPVWELPAVIRERRAAGYSTQAPRMAFWKSLALPVLLVAMALIGACVSMRFARGGGTWKLVLAGGAAGFAVFFASVFIEAFGEVGRLAPPVAAWTVPLLALALGAAYLARLEDG